MLVLETVAKIRREHFARGKGVETTVRKMGLARNIFEPDRDFNIDSIEAYCSKRTVSAT